MKSPSARIRVTDATNETAVVPWLDGRLRAGVQVRHPHFGVGTVMAVEEYNDDLKVTVRFATDGVKMLLSKYAKLEPA